MTNACFRTESAAYTSNDSQAASICDSSSQFRASCNVHTSQQYWVLDLQKIGEGGLDLLWGGHDGDVDGAMVREGLFVEVCNDCESESS